jgi:CRISPR-associated protein Cas2
MLVRVFQERSFGNAGMPYFIAVYDVNVKRVAKMLKLFRRYLHHVQNSVFEGELTIAQYQALQQDVRALMEEDTDSVIFYELRDERYTKRTVLGQDTANRSRFV